MKSHVPHAQVWCKQQVRTIPQICQGERAEAPAALLLVANLMPLQAPPVRTDAQIPPTRPAYSASARQETLRDAFYSVPSPPHPTSA